MFSICVPLLVLASYDVAMFPLVNPFRDSDHYSRHRMLLVYRLSSLVHESVHLKINQININVTLPCVPLCCVFPLSTMLADLCESQVFVGL